MINGQLTEYEVRQREVEAIEKVREMELEEQRRRKWAVEQAAQLDFVTPENITSVATKLRNYVFGEDR